MAFSNAALTRPAASALSSALEALAARFGNSLITSQAVREQHAHTTTWLPMQPPDAVVMVQLTQRVGRNMVFIPFHFHDCVNRLTLGLLDPYSRQPAFKQNACRIEHIDQQEAARLNLERRAF